MKNINDLYAELTSLKMLNNILIGCFASASPQFKSSLKFSLEEILSSGHELPGDFEDQARKILRHVCGEADAATSPKVPKGIFQLLQGGLADPDNQT